MNNFYIEDFVSVENLSKIIGISEVEFLKKTFLKGLIIKKNENLSFELAKNLCKDLFNINIFKKKDDVFSNKENNFFFISVTGNVNSGKTTLIDFIFKNNTSNNEIGKITQTVSIFEMIFLKKKIYFFDLPGHFIFNKVIKTFIDISNILFLIISIEKKTDIVYQNILNLTKEKKFNLIICINKIDIKNEKIFIKDFKNLKISSKNGFGIKKLILESINNFSRFNNFYFNNKYNGIIINSYYKNNIFFTKIFLLKGLLKNNTFLYFKNDKILIDNLYLNNIEVNYCISPCIIEIKNISFPIDYFFSIEKIKINKIESFKDNYNILDNWYVKSTNHTICISLLDFYNNLKFNDKINIVKISLGNFTENDFNYCKNFNCKIMLINNNLNVLIKKKLINNNFFIKEFNLINDVIDFFNNNYNLNKKEIKIGELLIKSIFPCGKNKKIAGCKVLHGYLEINNIIKVFKELKLIFKGKIQTLKNKDKNIILVKKNEECGVLIKNFNDIEIGMKIISYIYVDDK